MTRDERGSIVSWALYDWANSAYATTVMAGFFPVFFKEYWSVGVEATTSSARLGIANSAASVIVALMAPVLGAIGDRSTARKRFLLTFAFLGVAMTAALCLVGRGNWPAAVFFYAAATIGFSASNVFYDALLPAVASDEQSDVVSGIGYAFGYLGGGVLFAFNVWTVLDPERFGFQGADAAIRFSFVLVALWWAIFSLPLLLFVEEPRAPERTRLAAGAIRAGFAQLRETLSRFGRLRTARRFLIAYWLYIDGVDTIMRMAVDYGLSIGLRSQDLIVALLVTQFVGFPSAIAFGHLGKRIGAKRGIFIGIAVYLAISIWGAFINSRAEFFALAVIVGLVQGGVQSLSRSLFARFVPVTRSAEFFGFYNMLGKFAAVLGPLLMGMIGLWARSLGLAEQTASRVSITSISLLFLAGGALLYRVDEHHGADERRRFVDAETP